MLRRRLDPERHGSAGFTTIPRVVAIGAGVVFLALASHMANQAWYDGRILPGVTIGGQDAGGLSLAAARQLVGDEAGSYRLRLNVAGEHYQLTAAQLGVTFDQERTVDAAYASGRGAWLPPLHHEPVRLAYELNRSQLNDFAASVEQRVGTQPVDAGVVVKNGSLTTIPDKNGFTIDKRGLEDLVEEDVSTGGSGEAMDLTPRPQTADIRTGMLGPTLDEARRLMATPVVLTYKGQTYAPSEAQIGQWLAFVKQPDGRAFKLVPQVDTAKLKGYVQNLANRLDVDPVNQQMIVQDGVTKVQTQGVNGTAIDQDALTGAIEQAVNQQQSLTFAISDHNVPFRTLSTTLISLSIGTYIEVNLSKQHLWVWQDHQVIYDSPVTSGATGAGFPTATGLFAIYYKATNTHLVGYQYGPAYNYDVAVQYWMPFYKGFGLHDASWRHGNFGETSGPFGYYYDGSHGCINLPLATAAFLYNWSHIGTPVWVHN
jgi:lipoprotein-anchoring transpeptidase ErfK/SrfK